MNIKHQESKAMTADEKIKEVMELVGKYGTKVHENSVGSPSNFRSAHEEVSAYDDVQDKLRQLIKDDAQ